MNHVFMEILIAWLSVLEQLSCFAPTRSFASRSSQVRLLPSTERSHSPGDIVRL